MNRKVLVVVGVILLSLASCCGVCMIAGLVSDAPATTPAVVVKGGGGGKQESGLDGRYNCVQMGRMMSGSMLTVTSNPSISFSIDGERFSTGAGGGTVQREGDVVHFSGSDMNDWQGTMSPTGRIMYFRSHPTERHPGGGANNGETKCDRQQ